MTISKGMATFTLSGKLATVSGLVFPLSGLWTGGSTIYTSVGCTTLSSPTQIELQLTCYSRNFLVSARQGASELG